MFRKTLQNLEEKEDNMINQPTRKLTNVAAVIAASCLSVHNVTQAAEHTVKAEKFEQSITFNVVAMPLQSSPISVTPKAWGAFKIEKVLPQGSIVKKGDKLIWIDTEGLDKAIESTQKARLLQKLHLEKAQQELADLAARTPLSLADAKNKLARFQQDYDYYKKTTRPDMLDTAQYKVKQMKDYLSYAEEELKQLQKMYNEDGLTEDTEEIILQRAKNSVIANKRELKNVERKSKHTTEIAVPRLDRDWETSLKKEKLAYESSVKHISRNLKVKQLEVEKLVKEDAKKQEALEDLIADRKLMEFTSPIDGVVYFGEFKNGKWSADRARKVLYRGGDVPSRMTVMSIVPQDAKLVFNAFLTEPQKAIFDKAQPAVLKLKNAPLKAHAVVAGDSASYPNLAHQWLTSFSPKENMPAGVITGSQGSVTVITATADNVISVHKKAVSSHPDGTYSVKLKMAEGEPKETKVEVGRQAGDKLEITSGVEAGQVIITP